MTEFKYDEKMSHEVDGMRVYDLARLSITPHTVGTIAVIADAACQNLAAERPGWTGSEDYGDLFGSIGTLYQYLGNRMVAEVYQNDSDYDERYFAYKDMEDLMLSLTTVEQFGFLRFLVKEG